MANGGKDIKLGDDKRPVSVIPNNEQFLYNKANGQYLTDEFGNRLITKVDTYFIADSTMAKATSVAFLEKDNKYPVTVFSQVGTAITALCGNYEVVTGLVGTASSAVVKQANGTLVGVGTIVTTVDTNDTDVTWYDGEAATGLSASYDTFTERDPSLCAKWPVIRTVEEQPGPRNKLYFDQPGEPSTGVPAILGALQGGSGYSAATNVTTTVSPSGGTGLTVDITVSSTAIQTVTINTPGDGYSINDVVTVNGGTGGTFEITSLKSVLRGIAGLGVKFTDSLTSSNSSVAVGAASTQYVKVGQNHIVDGSQIAEASHNYRLVLNNNLNIEPAAVGVRHNTHVNIRRPAEVTRKSNATWKVEEVFKETSEVSSTLLGVNRAETQLSLFSNVSSYGLDPNEFEVFQWGSRGYGVPEWTRRENKTYGARYDTRVEELTFESGVQIGAFPVPYSYPFGPLWERVGAYNVDNFNDYKNFIKLGNDLYDLYTFVDPATNLPVYGNYPSDWKDNFLNKNITSINTDSSDPNFGDVSYKAGLTTSFAQIDNWTDTWMKLDKGELINPISNLSMNFGDIKKLVKDHNKDYSTDFYTVSGDTTYSQVSLPGYPSSERFFVQMQSRRVFRYQPGRISGFTFGAKSSNEFRAGYFNEWGISNPTDEYIFRIRSGQLYIVRRSPIPLGTELLKRNGIPENAEVRVDGDISGLKASGDPFRSESNHYVTEIATDYFNGDPLDGTGNSEYNVNASKVTMWKIEFGWYGAIGARFYAYVPAGNGDARWVVIHTLVIENQLGEPCLQDSYFRMIYRINVTNTNTFREPQQVTKYGASYYIDGGDEGTSTIYSAQSGEKKTVSAMKTSLGIKPKDVILNGMGDEIVNKKTIIPTKLNITAGALTKLSAVVCKGCPGYGYVYSPGVECGIPADGKIITPSGTATVAGDGTRKGIIFSNQNEIQTYAESGATADYFTVADIGAKIIAPSINDCYISSLSGDEGVDSDGNTKYTTAKLASYARGFNFIDGSKSVAGPRLPVLDQVTGEYLPLPIGSDYNNYNTNTAPYNTGVVYPHPIRLSQFTAIAASPYEFTGNRIEIRFLNPDSRDSYAHFSDFIIGLSKWKPANANGADLEKQSVNSLASFTNWTKNDGLVSGVEESIGGINRNVTNPPLNEIIFGEHSQTWARIDAEGNEIYESWSPQNPKLRMDVDYRIDSVPNPGGGRCCRLLIETEEPQTRGGVTYIKNASLPTPDLSDGALPNQTTEPIAGTGSKQFLVLDADQSWPDVTYNRGEIAFEEIKENDIDSLTGQNRVVITTVTDYHYVGEPQFYKKDFEGVKRTFRYIQFEGPGGTSVLGPDVNGNSRENTKLIIAYRPISSKAGGEIGQSQADNAVVSSRRLYEYNPFPLFLIIKMRDNSKVNSITVKEQIGNISKSITPPLYYLKETINSTEYDRSTITDADGNAFRNEASTSFTEIERLSSALVENQNEAKLRPGFKVIDNMYIGANDSKTIDLSDVFGADRQAIVPDNNNVESTFFVTERVDGQNAETTTDISINFKEQ